MASKVWNLTICRRSFRSHKGSNLKLPSICLACKFNYHLYAGAFACNTFSQHYFSGLTYRKCELMKWSSIVLAREYSALPRTEHSLLGLTISANRTGYIDASPCQSRNSIMHVGCRFCRAVIHRSLLSVLIWEVTSGLAACDLRLAPRGMSIHCYECHSSPVDCPPVYRGTGNGLAHNLCLRVD